MGSDVAVNSSVGSRRRQSTEAIFDGEQRRGQQQRRWLTEAVNRGSRRRQSTEAVDRGNLRRGATAGSTVNNSIGGRRRQSTEAVDGGNLWQGATLRSTAASAGRDGGGRRRPEFLLLASECGEGIKNRHLFLQYNSTCTKIVIRNRAQPNKRVLWCTQSMLAPVAVLH
jgi:hypothetical protein